MDDLHEGPSADTINYWATRLSPFLIKESVISNGNGNTATTTTTNQQKDDFFFITCNRTGTEKKSKFAGSSCALHFKQKGVADVELIAAMSRKEGVQVMELLRTSHVMKRV